MVDWQLNDCRWWEGVVKDIKDMDENKITLYFPGLQKVL
jgi:hypothetical protein